MAFERRRVYYSKSSREKGMPHKSVPYREIPGTVKRQGKVQPRAFTVVSAGKNGLSRVGKFEQV